MRLFWEKCPFSRPKFLMTFFSHRPSFSDFTSIRQTLLLKILGGRMHGPSPTSNFWGTVPPAPLGLRPCLCVNITSRPLGPTLQYHGSIATFQPNETRVGICYTCLRGSTFKNDSPATADL